MRQCMLIVRRSCSVALLNHCYVLIAENCGHFSLYTRLACAARCTLDDESSDYEMMLTVMMVMMMMLMATTVVTSMTVNVDG